MRIRAWIAMAAGIAAATPALAQQAPFCAVTGFGPQCHYYSLSACQQAVRGLDGACVANLPQPQPQQMQIQPVQAPRQVYDINKALHYTDTFQSALQAREAGARDGQARAEHEARMRLLEAQIQAQERQRDDPHVQRAAGSMVAYRCPDPNGSVRYSSVPEVGCVVVVAKP